MEPDVTVLRLKYLKAIEEICVAREFGLAIPIEVETKMRLRLGTSKSMLRRLLEIGFLERPYRGCYYLSEKGRKILAEAEGNA